MRPSKWCTDLRSYSLQVRDKDLIMYGAAQFGCLFLDVYPVGMFVAKINEKIRPTVYLKPVVRSPSRTDANPSRYTSVQNSS